MNLLTNIKNQIPGVSITEMLWLISGETEDDF